MSIYSKLIKPVLFRLDPETAHELGVAAMKRGFGRLAGARPFEDASLNVDVCGLRFANPLGLAAGFDKNGVVVAELAALGFGFVEVGTVTREPQPGNERPRLFRLPADEALINRFGFNNDGAAAVVERLRNTPRGACVVGVNIGRNKSVANEDAIGNYLASFDLAHPVADYVAVNVSSPNTPNLRELQQADSLEELLAALARRNAELGAKPLFVKIAPDLSDGEVEASVDVARRLGLSGVIATNTTTSRAGLRTRIDEAGGLSGAPVRRRSTEIVRLIYKYSGGALPIIGVGGIFTAADAFEKIAAGASLVQAYTGFIYGGPTFAGDVCAGLAVLLKEKGFASVSEAVGSAVGTE